MPRKKITTEEAEEKKTKTPSEKGLSVVIKNNHNRSLLTRSCYDEYSQTLFELLLLEFLLIQF